MCARDRARAAPRRPRRHGPGLRRPLRRRLPGGPDLGGGDGGGALRRPQPDRDRRLQPPADRRHDRGGHGHRRRARQVRGLRLGRGRDRRPRHGRGRRGARAQPHPATARRRSSARRRRARASRSMEGRFGFHGKPPTPGAGRRRRWRSSRRSSTSRPRRCEAADEASDVPMSRGQDRADRDPARPTATRWPSWARRHEDVVALDADLAVSTQSIKFGKRFPERFFNCRRGRGQHDVDGLRPRRDRQGPLRVDLRDLRHRPRLRPGPARHRPQRAEGADRRLPRRRLARRGRRLAPDDRGHRADAGDAADAGRRARPTTTRPTGR